jgi:hypothetical protein
MPIIDKFQGKIVSYEMPSNHLLALTPNDAVDLTYVTRGIYIGGAGDLAVRDEFNNDVTFTNLVPGIILPIRVVRIFATGTSVTDIIGLI